MPSPPYNSTDNPNPNGNPPGGRPLKYDDPDELQRAIDQYFDDCDQEIIVKQHPHSKGITEVKTPKPYTMAGLARALNIDRDTLNNYKKYDRFFGVIMRARDKVHEQNLSLALLGCHDSKIAALNLASNYGYATKKDVDITDNSTIQAVLDALPDDIRENVLDEVKSRLGKK